MALSTEQLSTACDLVSGAGSLREAALRWREHYPDARVLVVDAHDMRDELPMLLLGRRRVYLAASNGHCWHVTSRPEEADALILSQD